MGCTSNITLSGVSFNCDDVPYGGLTKLLLVNKADADSYISVSSGVVTITDMTPISGKVVELSFSNKDAFTNASETKTVDPTGSVKTEQIISVEFPKMDSAKRAELDAITVPYAQLIAFTTESTGEHKMYGYEFGMYASEVIGATGNGRGEKNTYQLKLSAEENHLAYTVDSTNYALVENGL